MAMVISGRESAAGNPRRDFFSRTTAAPANRRRGPPRTFVGVLVLGILLAEAGGFSRAWGQASPPTEYDVKAAYLYNFGGYVKWPVAALAREGDFLFVCLLGDDPFGSTLDEMLKGKTAHDKKLKVRRISELDRAADCHILFIGSSEESRLAEILTAVQGRGVLTVGEMRRFAQRGGMIGFILEGGRVRLEINLEAAQGEGFSLSSQLLKLARVIGVPRPSGD
ncbi:MAG: YfiR family protein [Candidatus Acidiferrales bacterium]